MTCYTRIFFVLILILLTCSGLNAQVQAGTPRFASFGGGPESINLANLNAHFNIPILNKAGRGLPFNFYLTYDTAIWYPAGTWMPVSNYGWSGSEVNVGFVGYSLTINRVPTPCGKQQGATVTYIYYWSYSDGFGTQHKFPNPSETIYEACGNIVYESGGGTAEDGSGYTLSATGSTFNSLYSTDGNQIFPIGYAAGGMGSVQDRNGNEITDNGSGSLYDTLSSTTAVLTISGSGTASSPVLYKYTAPSGATATYTINYTNYTVATNFGVSGIGEYKSTAAVPLVSSIVLPDGSKYTFEYEATPGSCTPYSGTTCTTARPISIALPPGGTITYAYSGGNYGILPDGSTATLTRTTPDGTWKYAQVKGSGAASTTTITDPQSNVTTMQFQGIYPTQSVVKNSSGTTLLTTSTCYNAASSPCTGTAVTPPITQANISNQLGGANNLTDLHVQQYDGYGNLKEQDDYDYGSGSYGSLLGKTTITYASLGNIRAFRQTVTRTSGTTVSQTNYNYDQTPVQGTSGTPQHTSVSGSRGNLTSVNFYTSGSNYLTQTMTYFDTGNMQTLVDVNGTQATYTYTYGACGNSFLTNVAEPLSMSRTSAWDSNCTGGVITALKDENQQTTSATYSDSYYWRPAAVTDPTGATVGYNYQPNPTNCCPWEVTSSLTFNNGNSTVQESQYKDGLGRTYTDQHLQSPNASLMDTVSYTFDSNGRLNSVSMPCAVSWTATCSTPKTTTTYDALNRVVQSTGGGGGTASYTYSNNDVLVKITPAPSGENAKQRQLEYDSLGRLTSVCEITSASGSGTCGQNTPQNGYWTKYTYDAAGRLTGVTQNAQSSSTQTRSYAYDLSGRLTSETNPENGTTAYTYDTDSTCGTSSGDLVKRVDAMGNVTCISYDALHRSTAITYPSGSYASITPAKHFVYDSSTVDGTSMLNAKARLAEAYTCTGSCTSKITDLGFSYTARGEISDEYQTSPNSAGWYHANFTYWPNGALEQVSGLPTLPTFTYGLDGEGRINTMSASTGQNPLTGTTYNTSSQPTGVTFGSGDSDAFTYDSNTGRMTQYQFNIGSQSFVGKLTWNANSTLASQQIIDPFNSADNQTCNSAHDDMIRIASVNCGSVWSQTFTYDAFGNISKSGSATFAASYNPATNRISSVGGFTPTYDANGNTLAGTTHTYTWDADGNHASVDGIGLTFDALGRSIEVSYPSEIFYLPDGSQVLFKGQVARGGVFRLPGGAQVNYDSANGGLQFYAHADHLGSLRLISTPGRAFSSSLAYAPFGEEYAQSNSNAGGNAAFTGWGSGFAFDEFDFPARQYSNQGRWVSPDPAGLAAANPTNPQSWNRYAYVRNNPLASIDPLGLHDPSCDPNDPTCPCDPYTGICGPCPFGGNYCPVPGPGGGGGGEGGGGGGRPGGPVAIPEPPINVGVPDDPGMGPGPIWTEQIPIGTGPVNPYLIIQNFIGLSAHGGWTGTPCPPLLVGVWYQGVGCGYPLIGVGGGAGAVQYQQYQGIRALQTMGGTLKKPVVEYLCGPSPIQNIVNYTAEGASKGAIYGFRAGGWEGALGGGISGGAGGELLGMLASAACSFAGAYPANVDLTW